MEFYTLGHSDRSLEFVVGLLLGYGIQRLVDIRTIPRSLHNPQFNRDTFSLNLQAVGVHYTHMPGLGGLRRARPDSVNKGWTNSSFRGYADYMQTSEFTAALDSLITLGEKERIAFMCAEAVPWRCHRSLVSDALTIRHISVYHIMSRVSATLHQITPMARIKGLQLTYPLK